MPKGTIIISIEEQIIQIWKCNYNTYYGLLQIIIIVVWMLNIDLTTIINYTKRMEV